MVEFFWVWVAAGGGLAVGMFLFAVMTMAANDPQSEVVSASHTDALT